MNTVLNNNERTVFHEGELAVQNRLGVAERVQTYAPMMIRDHMPQQHQDFYAQLPMLFVGFADRENQVWASVLANSDSLVNVKNDRALSINTRPFEGDPLTNTIEQARQNKDQAFRLGMLGIELHTRRRNRMSAQLAHVHERGFDLDVVQTFGNCPQYIQTRRLVESAHKATNAETIEITKFDDALSSFIKQADTFFVASSTKVNDSEQMNDASGADVSHRGGRPGFIRVDDDKTLTIPDYMGNNIFNTLGNFMVNDSAGLLFIDFETGDIITLTGKAKILWDDATQQNFQGAERLWQFTLTKGYILKAAMPFRFALEEMSPNSMMTGTWQEAEARAQQQLQQDQWSPWYVDKIIDESPHIRSFYLDTGTGATPQFKPGQFITLKVEIAGKEHIRNYSVSSSPLDKFIRISVKRDGLVSNYLHDTLKVGSQIAMKLPVGGFHLSENEQLPAILLSAGVGITPMMSMFRHAIKENLRARKKRPVIMLNSFRHAKDQAFYDEANRLARESDGTAKAFWLLTQPESDAKLGVDYSAQGRLDKDKLQAILPFGRYEFYLCGPADFMQQTYDLLIDLGVHDSDIYAEAFGPASMKRVESNTINKEGQADAIADQAVIEFSASGVEQGWAKEDGNLLDFAESHGLTPTFGCRSGSCGSCKVKITHGKVVHSSSATFPVDKDEALLCCAKPKKREGDIPVKLVLEA